MAPLWCAMVGEGQSLLRQDVPTDGREGRVRLRAGQAITAMLLKQSRQLAVAPKITNQPSLEAIGIKAFTPRFLELSIEGVSGGELVAAQGADPERATSYRARGIVAIDDRDGLDHYFSVKGSASMGPARAVEDMAREVVIARSLHGDANLEVS